MGTTFTSGELARITGLTVRTLHHYEQIGLLLPLGRTLAGHRYYGTDDVLKLQQILFLKDLGLSLEEIKEILLQPDFSALGLLKTHYARLEHEIENARALKAQIGSLISVFESLGTPSVRDYIKTIEMMRKTFGKYLTADQHQEIVERFRQRNLDIKQESRRWSLYLSEFETAMKHQMPPSHPLVQALAKAWEAQVELFAGKSASVRQISERFYAENPDIARSLGMKPHVLSYIDQAVRFYRENPSSKEKGDPHA